MLSDNDKKNNSFTNIAQGKLLSYTKFSEKENLKFSVEINKRKKHLQRQTSKDNRKFYRETLL